MNRFASAVLTCVCVMLAWSSVPLSCRRARSRQARREAGAAAERDRDRHVRADAELDAVERGLREQISAVWSMRVVPSFCRAG
jgi:hypothetical protein